MKLTDINISQSRQALPELIHLGLVRLDLLAILILVAALLLSMEPQVLQQDNLSIARLVNGLLDLLAHAVVREDDLLAAEQLLQLGDYGLQAVLGVGLAVGPAEMRHQDYAFGAVLDGVFDGGKGAHDALVVCDFLVAVEGNVEVDLEVRRLVWGGLWKSVYSPIERCFTYADEHALVLEVDVGD